MRLEKRAWKTGRDGVKRCVTHAETRIDAEQLSALEAIASGKGMGYGEFMDSLFQDAVLNAIEDNPQEDENGRVNGILVEHHWHGLSEEEKDHAIHMATREVV